MERDNSTPATATPESANGTAGPWGPVPDATSTRAKTDRESILTGAASAVRNMLNRGANERLAAEERSIEPVLERDRDPEARQRDAKPNDQRAAEPDAPSAEKPNERAAAPATSPAERKISVEAGNVPDAIRKKYLIQTDPLFKGQVAFHTDAKGTTPAFKDSGAKLTTQQTSEAVVRDMVATAEHRGWSEIQVKGDEAFRRAVWLEAAQKGIEVSGYRPSERDLQQLEKLMGSREVGSIEAVPERVRGEAPQAVEPDGKPTGRPDFDAGVTGVLVGEGIAPYKHDPANDESAFIKLQLASGEVQQVWGVGLPDALERANVMLGDTITVKRDGVEQVEKPVKVVDKATGQERVETRTVDRNKWEVVADRFREGSPAENARDPELKGAQSTQRAVETLLQQVPDKGLRDKLIEAAKEHVASKLQAGHQFRQHRVREERIKDPSPANRRKEQRVKTKAATNTRQAEVKREDKIKKNPERSRSR